MSGELGEVGAGDPAFPPIQRVVTGHDENGRAVFSSEDLREPQPIPTGDANFPLLCEAPPIEPSGKRRAGFPHATTRRGRRARGAGAPAIGSVRTRSRT